MGKKEGEIEINLYLYTSNKIKFIRLEGLRYDLR